MIREDPGPRDIGGTGVVEPRHGQIEILPSCGLGWGRCVIVEEVLLGIVGPIGEPPVEGAGAGKIIVGGCENRRGDERGLQNPRRHAGEMIGAPNSERRLLQNRGD